MVCSSMELEQSTPAVRTEPRTPTFWSTTECPSAPQPPWNICSSSWPELTNLLWNKKSRSFGGGLNILLLSYWIVIFFSWQLTLEDQEKLLLKVQSHKNKYHVFERHFFIFDQEILSKSKVDLILFQTRKWFYICSQWIWWIWWEIQLTDWFHFTILQGRNQ